MDEKEKLEKLNRFTRREHKVDEVYIFDVVLCDNEIDRDGERFSVPALRKLKELFVGKTGISDHEAKSSGQTARIFDTVLETDSGRKTAAGEDYVCLKASAYMVRTNANSDLIREIDGGIKKEVSVSCSAGKRICSVCGADRNKKGCQHVCGKKYGSKTAHVILDDIKDAYEWSFVAVPAQISAGVTRKFFGGDGAQEEGETEPIIEKLCGMLRSDITKLCFLSSSQECSKAIAASAEKMSPQELMDFKSVLEKEYRSKIRPQLDIYKESVDAFRMQEGVK
ncbi:MAG: hypothetical protein ACI4I9_05175 [Porcipelethomonas sp.]